MNYTDIINIIKGFGKNKTATIGAVLLYLAVSYNKEMIGFIYNSINNNMNAIYTQRYIVYSVWWHSELKASGIRSFLYEYYPYRSLSDKEIEIYIRNILDTNTSKYIIDFNNAPLFKNHLGTWYLNNFKYDEFFKDAFAVVLIKKEFKTEQERILIIEGKVRLVLEIMKSYQAIAATDLNTYLSETPHE